MGVLLLSDARRGRVHRRPAEADTIHIAITAAYRRHLLDADRGCPSNGPSIVATANDRSGRPRPSEGRAAGRELKRRDPAAGRDGGGRAKADNTLRAHGRVGEMEPPSGKGFIIAGVKRPTEQ
jgi:hypothetical protein